ncbi:hypothetical protein DFA_05079 [Cavenderia fasciculata]|uniref:Uncharacterized protein n=1 Tax=Cavenderia fasciculata TaxID=261658 RepID=F4PN96_CACFS|nr:uncharacterized protein DFA_05079 [Cavenderia fasciculata]EGG22949.1 hypothetical protein DFA_05079 [Cavenderia fasciculata]|eukprot:XP_004360800.1 hypothetical protein DFA_05079 [Cavenderia fasciculata]
MSVIQLSQYIQTFIIRLLLIGSNTNEDKDTYKGSDYWFVVFNGEKRRQPINAINMIDIALVSKWWLKVVRQRSSMLVLGFLYMAIERKRSSGQALELVLDAYHLESFKVNIVSSNYSNDMDRNSLDDWIQIIGEFGTLIRLHLSDYIEIDQMELKP